MTDLARLLIDCPDNTGLVSAISGFIGAQGGNILEADQHTDPNEDRFFMRVEFDRGRVAGGEEAFVAAWSPLAAQHDMRWRLAWTQQKPRVMLLASKETHCLSDLLWRFANHEFQGEVIGVISNHETGRAVSEALNVPFHHEPVTRETKAAQERRVRDRLDASGAELVVLARYMQILSPELVESYAGRVINVHHSFLPAFAGARPYHQAFERGVKLIGATSHYVTAELDAGPIIAQSTAAISHRDTVQDLMRKGRDLERVVLADAVRLHLEDKIIRCGGKTVVFE